MRNSTTINPSRRGKLAARFDRVSLFVLAAVLAACEPSASPEDDNGIRRTAAAGQAVCHKALEDRGICFTALAALLTNPGAYDGRKVSFVARLYVDDGPPAVYLSDMHYSTHDDMASIEIIGSQRAIKDIYDHHSWGYVQLTGVFSAFDGAETSRMRAGTLSDVSVVYGITPRDIDTTQGPWLRLDQSK